MQFITRHILIAPRDPQRYSEIVAPDISCFGKVPLDMLESASENTGFTLNNDGLNTALACSESTGFNVNDNICDRAVACSDISSITVVEPNYDTVTTGSELNAFELSAAS